MDAAGAAGLGQERGHARVHDALFFVIAVVIAQEVTEAVGGEEANLQVHALGGLALGLAAAVYPMSQRDARGRLSGFGLAGAVTTAVGSEVPVEIDEEVFDFPVSQRTWQIGLHYRWPAGPALVDGHLGYGSITHYVDDMPEDADLELDLLDAEYGFLDLGGRVEIEAGPRTTLGFSASYLYMTQVGIVTDPDLLGGVQSWGMKMGLDLKVQLKKGVYAAAGADYRRVSMVFDGDGELFDEVDVDDAKDTFVGGHLDVGVAF